MALVNAAVPHPQTPQDTVVERTAGKGLKAGSLGLGSLTVIGIASTAPAYSLAATLGAVVVLVGLQSPIIVALAFIPAFLVAQGYKELNKADPDCGTTFTWATRGVRSHHRLDRRLGDRGRRPPGDGEPGTGRRSVRLPALWC